MFRITPHSKHRACWFVGIVSALTWLLAVCTSVAIGGDWPMWRFDAGRTASSPHALPDGLSLVWTRKYPARVQTWDDTLNNDLMQYDRVFEPIVLGQHVVVGFNDSDKVVCWDIADGKEVWRFYTDGPVRMPPAGDGDKVFVTSDDGHLYCLSVADGKLLWKFRGGPSDRKVLGNTRVVSMWPARGGAVVRDGHVYFAASIWPFMGTFLYDLDADTGEVVWVNDRTSASYIKQPHSAPSFAGIAPQGAIVATKSSLVVPGGRSVPAVFDRQTGELSYFELNAGGKGNGGSTVISTDEHFYLHTRGRSTRRFNLESGKKTALQLNEPVFVGDYIITSDESSVRAMVSNEDGTQQDTIWELEVDGGADLIRAGNRLYVAGANAISVIELTDDYASPNIIATLPAKNTARLVAGGGALLAVSLDGQIQCFGTTASDREPIAYGKVDAVTASLPTSAEAMRAFVAEHDAEYGYAFVFGVESHEMLDALLAGSELKVVALSEDGNTVQALRRRYDDRGLYGTRVTLHEGSPSDFQAPAYIAQLVVVAPENAEAYLQPNALTAIYQSVRPYGGTLWVPNATTDRLDAAVNEASLAKANVDGLVIKRTGSIEGAAPWTHLYGDVANTVKSNDRVVKAPLGILWFGGNTHHDVLPRHSHAPSEQVLNGRLFVEGVNTLSARDVYTGRLIWRREFSDLGTSGIYYDDTYRDTPLSTKYNQVHIPGANARGTNFVAANDGVYLVSADRCEVLDPKAGETLRTIVLPKEVNPKGEATWTYIGIYDDFVIAGVDFANGEDATRLLKELPEDSKNRSAAWSPEWFASRRVAVMNRETGELVWHADATYSFLHNGIIAGGSQIFLLDKLPQSVEEQRSRRGFVPPSDYRILACDVETGEQSWQIAEKVFGTWLSYSAEYNTLIHAGAAAPDRSKDEAKAGIRAIDANSGEPLWEDLGLEYSGPCILHHDKVIMNSRSYAKTSGVVDIRTGKPVLIDHPVTGDQVSWTYQRAYGCNTAVASEHLLTFRSGAAGYYDLDMKCGVANLGGFRSGCTSNLIAADGVLNAPDFTRTCSCGYQNQTSLALVHMPDVEVWAANPFAPAEDEPIKISRLGINFGAAGTRRADDGTVWMEYPPTATKEFPLDVKVEGDVRYSRRHSSSKAGERPWVSASTVAGFDMITIKVSDAGSQKYSVRLHFADEVSDGSFSVQGHHADAKPAGANWQSFSDIICEAGVIRIERQRDVSSAPALAGVEVFRVEKALAEELQPAR